MTGRWLVVGGAGYIGCHISHELVAQGHDVMVLDDLSSGSASSIPATVELIRADARDAESVHACLKRHGITGLIHLAARKQARESMRLPLAYWKGNLGATLGLLEGMRGTSVKHLVFSSSCSVYGSVEGVTPDSPLRPLSPYAQTKIAGEWLLRAAANELGIDWTILRYFNVIGNGPFSDACDRSTECLVPAAWRLMTAGTQPEVFGTDLDTPDGTALRDYIDVRDLASAHAIVAEGLQSGSASVRNRTLNVSTGTPVSVRDILELLAPHAGWDSGFRDAGRRAADPVSVWAQPSPELGELGWRARYSLAESIASFAAAHARA